MNGNLFFGFLSLAFAIALWACTYFAGVRKKGMDKRCTMHTTGQVIGFSSVHYAGMSIPLVEFSADNRKYKVSGPKFRGGTFVSVSTPFSPAQTRVETNLTTREALPLKLKVKVHRNSFVSAYVSPLSALYPVGSAVEVYYNPQKPREAYVQRFEGVSTALTITLLCLAIVVTALSLVFFIGPRITLT